MKKGIYRLLAVASAVSIMASTVTVQASMVTTNGTAGTVTTDSITGWPTAPSVSSETAVLIDADTGAVLYDKGMEEYRYPASITKLMTILVAVENSSLTDEVTFTETGIRDITWDSSNINAQLGEVMTMEDCLHAAYIESANEVCAQIAEYVGGTEENFVEMMNQKAQELGCTHTHFANANGLPDENHYTCALDMAKIMRAGLNNKEFCDIIGDTDYTIPATNKSEKRSMHTHVPLMAKESAEYYEGCIGGKTGNTNDAKHTLVIAAKRNGHTYIAVTLRAEDLGINCSDSKALFDYAFNSFDNIIVGNRHMTVPKGVTEDQLTAETVENNGKITVRYYYSGQFVGDVAEIQATSTPTPEPTETIAESIATETADDEIDGTVSSTQQQTQSFTEQISEIKENGLSNTMKLLLGLMGAMVIVLIVLLVVLHKKNR